MEPNKVITKPKKRNKKDKKKNSAKKSRTTTAPLFSSPVSSIPHSPTVATPTFPTFAIPLTEFMVNMFHMINDTYSNITHSCWLCYNIAPPYYEGIALLSSNVSYSKSSSNCQWSQKSGIGLSLYEVSGLSTLIGKIQKGKRQSYAIKHLLFPLFFLSYAS